MRLRAVRLCVFLGLSFSLATAEPREDSLAYNSRCLRAHAAAHNYILSTAQNSALEAAALDPKRVLGMLISYVKESLADFQNGVRLGTSNPKLDGIDAASKQELVASFRKDAENCASLLRLLTKFREGRGFSLTG